MLPKNKRLNLKNEFNRVEAGFRAQSPSFKLKYRFDVNDHPLIGIAISSKLFKKAVMRNKAKRITSAAIEIIYSRLRNNLNLVIMPKLEVLNKRPKELSEELTYVENLFVTD